MTLLEVDKFELTQASGVMRTVTHSIKPVGWLGRKPKSVTIEEPKDFIYDPNSPLGELPTKEDCDSYTWSYVGGFELVYAFVYLTRDLDKPYEEFPCYSLHLLGHKCVNLATRFVSLHIDPTIGVPRAEFEFDEQKNHSEKSTRRYSESVLLLQVKIRCISVLRYLNHQIRFY